MAEPHRKRKAGALAVDDRNDHNGHHAEGANSEMQRARDWSVAEAKAKFSQLIEQARTAPQTITRNGRPAVVVVSVEEWQCRASRSGSLVDFLAASPLRASGLNVERSGERPRDIGL